MPEVQVTLIAENTARGVGLLGEHGLAWWIDTGTHRVLFDTGQGMTLMHNAERLGIDLARADAIVLSHGHYDHVSGLEDALAQSASASLWLHPAATERKYIRASNGKPRRVSTDFMERGDFGARRNVHLVTTPQEVVSGVWVTGEVPRCNDFEDTGGPFYLDEQLAQVDPIRDDMSLFLPQRERVSVIFGCAHAGSANTLAHILGHCGELPVDTLLGGLHLAAASAQRMERTVALLHELSPRRMGFCHCTGAAAIRRLAREFPEAMEDLHAGSRLTL